MSEEVAVVGSGPAGVAAAWALIERGMKVSLLDAGNEIESELKQYLEGSDQVDYPAFLNSVRLRRLGHPKSPAGLPEKLPFGSRFVYAAAPGSHITLTPPAVVVTSYALGGLSNVWGANVNALATHDIEGWPLATTELAPYFAKLDQFIDVASDSDALDKLYSFRIGSAPTYPLGPQGEMILSTVRANQEKLTAAGLYAGRAKIAVGRRYSAGNVGCRSCGLCMHGCPHNAIFNSASVVRVLKDNQLFRYQPGIVVHRFEEQGHGVRVFGRERSNRRPNEEGSSYVGDFSRIFIAAGVLSSTAIVARSLGWCAQEFEIKDSQKWYFPFLTTRRVRNCLNPQANTLAQLFFQTRSLESTRNTVHGQLYGFNDLVLESLLTKLGCFSSTFSLLAKPVLERLMIGMVYLHSNDSGSLYWKVNDLAKNTAPLGELRGTTNPRADQIAQDFWKLLSKHRTLIGGRPIPQFAKKGVPGRSQHFGGTLPMSSNSVPRTTDMLGKPHGCSRVHVVDSSVFPSIPGTPTTYPVMANAYRIATLA